MCLELSKEPAPRLEDATSTDESRTHLDQRLPNHPERAIRTASALPSTDALNQNFFVRGRQSARGFIPMPPIPDQIPRLSDTSPSGRKFTWVEALEHNASLLEDQSLYRAFQLRRNKNLETKGPKLITAMAEYVGDAEERFNTLHQSLQRSTVPATRLHGGMPVHVEGASDKTGETGGQEAPISAGPSSEVLLETRFYHCEDLFYDWMRGSVQNSAVRNQAVGGHYTSACDPNYLIRVHFEWNKFATSSRQPLVAGDMPDAKDIDVLTFMVSSRPLTAFFERRLGLEAGADKFPVLKLGKPFRVIISNFNRLKDQLAVLMNRYGSRRAAPIATDLREQPSDCQSSSQRNVSTADQPPDDDQHLEPFDQQPALEHFRLLIQFVHQYLGQKVALLEAFRAGRPEMVSYEDLWMLFNNGDKVFSPLREKSIRTDFSNGGSEPKVNTNRCDENNDDHYHATRRRYVPQAYRVMASIGGAPLVSSFKTVGFTWDKLIDDLEYPSCYGGRSAPSEMQRAKEMFSSLRVFCMYVDFDGTKYATDIDIFVFKPFDGQVHIKTLEAYPLRYSDSPSWDDLIQRGQKFIDVTTLPRHMDHAGMTIGETKEEVRV